MNAIRFQKVPETEVRFPDSNEQRSGSHTERENLPDQIEPGVTYREAKIRWRAEALLRAEVPPVPRREGAGKARRPPDFSHASRLRSTAPAVNEHFETSLLKVTV